jgi:uncharacterized protein (TIGR00297 family)
MGAFLTLNERGIIAALVIGVAILFFGADMGSFFLAVMVFFLVLSAIATKMEFEKKLKMRAYEKVRGWRNVVANGIVPSVAALAYFLNLNYSFLPKGYLVIAFVASVAGITADKFSSEIGILNGEPRMLLTTKKVKKGRSGAVTALGLVVGLFAAFAIGLSVFVFGIDYRAFYIIVLSGFLGNLFDSVLGYFEEKGIGNKFTSNAFCALFSWLFCLAVLVY